MGRTGLGGRFVGLADWPDEWRLVGLSYEPANLARIRRLARSVPGAYIVRMDESYADTVQAQMIADYVGGGETLIDACAWVGISYFGLYKKMKKDEKLAELMNTARAAGADVIASNNRKIMRGEEGYSTGDWKRDRFLVDTNNKLLAVWHPKQYGAKLEIEQRSANVEVPVGDDPVAAMEAYKRLMGD